MDLSYTITREQYLSALELSFKERMRALPWRIFLFLTTIGQLLIFAAIILSRRPEGRELYILVGCPLMLLALSFCYFGMSDWQARADMKKLKNSGLIGEDFWSPHRISYRDTTVIIKIGKRELALDHWVFRVLRHKGLVLIMSGSKLVEAIPEDQLDRPAEDFIALLRQCLAKSAARSAQSGLSAQNGKLLGSIDYSFDPSGYAAAQCRAKRALYLSPRSFSLLRLFLLALCVFIIYYTVVNFTLPGLVSCVLLCLLINLNPLMIFSPWAQKWIMADTRRLSDFYPGQDVTLRLYEKDILFKGECYCLGIPHSEISAHFLKGDLYCIFTRKGSCFTVPGCGEGSERLALLRSVLGPDR